MKELHSWWKDKRLTVWSTELTRSHGEKVHVCAECGKSIWLPKQLRLHTRTISGEKSYVCGRCEKSFSSSSNLKSHERRVHTGERPFVCSSCWKRFAAQNTLKQHMYQHFDEKPFTVLIQEGLRKISPTLKKLRTHKTRNPGC